MRKSGLIATAALMAVALPLMAVSASAQNKLGGPGGGGRGAVAAGSAVKGGMVGGGGAFRGGGGGAFRGGMVGAGPRVGWSGPRPGWNGGPSHHRRYGSRFYGPGIGFGTGLLLGGAFAAQPYYGSGYGTPYYDEPYDDGYVYAAPGGASPDDVAYCQQRYRSYDIRSGTYLNNDGNRYPCP